MGLLSQPDPELVTLVCTAVPRFSHKPPGDVTQPGPVVGTTYYAARSFLSSNWWRFWPVTEGDPRSHKTSYANRWTQWKEARFVVRDVDVIGAFTEAAQKEQEAAA